MQSIPDARHQTFEEIYGPPENFLEIEVSDDLISFSIVSSIDTERASHNLWFARPLRDPVLTFLPMSTGPQPSNPRHITINVHIIRDRMSNQYPRIQTQTFGRTPSILGLRIFPWHSWARVFSCNNSSTAGEGVHQPIQRRSNWA